MSNDFIGKVKAALETLRAKGYDTAFDGEVYADRSDRYAHVSPRHVRAWREGRVSGLTVCASVNGNGRDADEDLFHALAGQGLHVEIAHHPWEAMIAYPYPTGYTFCAQRVPLRFAGSR